MMLFDRLFKEGVTEKDQWAFLGALQALSEDFLFIEKLESITLRACEIKAGIRKLLPNEEIKDNLPLVTLHHLGRVPKREPGAQSLAERFLPYPWSELLGPGEEKSAQISFSDDGLARKSTELREQLSVLEKNCLQTELSCIDLSAHVSNRSLILHGVRGKIIRAAACSSELIQTSRPEFQRTRFSTTAFGTDKPMNLKGFELASHLLRTASRSEHDFTSSHPKRYLDEAIHFEL